MERQEVWGGVTWLWWRCLCEKEPEWKERSQLERIAKKIITGDLSSKKNAHIDVGVISFNRWKT